MQICSLFTLALSVLIVVDGFQQQSAKFANMKETIARSSIEVERTEKSRTIISVASVTSWLFLSQYGKPPKAEAFDLFPSAEQQQVNSVSVFQKPVLELLNQLRPYDTPNALGVYSKQQVLKGGQEDSNVVLLYLINYITPMQKKMAEVAGNLKLGEAEQERIELLPKLMLGHTLELKDAIESLKADDQLREMTEVWETLQEFLRLASTKYNVVEYVDIKQISDKDLLGPLGCEFWNKKRAEGSNACVDLN